MPIFPIIGAVIADVGAAAAAVGSAVVGGIGAAAGAVGAGLGAIGAAAGVTGAGVSAGTSILAGGLIAGSVAEAGISIASASGAFTAKPSTINPNPQPTAAQTVDNSGAQSNVNNLGRAALIATSPQGVEGTSPQNRYSLLGTSSAIT